MKKKYFFTLTLSLAFGMTSLFASNPVKPADPVKPEMWKAPEQSYIWIKYKCATSASNPQDVEIVTGYLSTAPIPSRPCYRPTNWQGSTVLQTGMITCPNINVFQECTAPWGNICAVRYLATEIEPVTPAQNVNIRPKTGVTFAGHDIAYCGSSLPNPPCTYPISPACTNSYPWNTAW